MEDKGLGAKGAWEGGGGAEGEVERGGRGGQSKQQKSPPRTRCSWHDRGKSVAGAKRVNFILMVAHCSGGQPALTRHPRAQ